jgi:hypothetical protein
MVEGKFKVVFEPGAFDGFEGTQEELDELVAEITRLAESGEILEQGMLLGDIDEDELDGIEDLISASTARVLN